MYLFPNPDVIHRCSNSQTLLTWAKQPQIHAQMMKIRLKLEKINLSSLERISLLDNNETSPIWFVCVFHKIWSQIVFLQSWWKVSLMRFDEWKSWKLGERKIYVLEWYEKIKFYYLYQFSYFTHFDELKIS
jgi:hypothetical protein